jgi:hypothetical protein
MNGVREFRAKTILAPDDMEARWQKLAPDDDYVLLVTGPARIYKPNGKLLAQYIPGAFSAERMNEFWDTLYALRKYETGNRGYASGTKQFPAFAGSTRMRTVPVSSAIVGAFDPGGQYFYCRLTAFTVKDFDKYQSLFPLFQDIGKLFAENVTDRYQAQMAYINQTHPDWVIPGTPFSTVTVNTSYPTGYHTDQGDLDEGFSCLTVLRRGNYSGGRLVFPEYGIAVDMQNGDQLLMDAHAAHGNTQLYCGDCGNPMGPGAPVASERGVGDGWVHKGDRWVWSHEANGCTANRISVVSYYRTKLKDCESAAEEAKKAALAAERRADLAEERTLADQMVAEMAQETVPR